MPERAACSCCGYPLRGLGEPRCPECGQPFDPDDARTFVWDAAANVNRHRLWRACVAGVVVAGLVVVGWTRIIPVDWRICGPLGLLGSQAPTDRYVGLLLTALLALAITSPLLRLHVGTVILSALGIAAWLAMGTVLCSVASI